MNAEDIVKVLRHCYSENIQGCEDCPFENGDKCYASNVELKAADLIESLQAQLERFNATLAREGFTELETMIAKYKTVILAANELSTETDEEIEALREQLKESQRRERAAVEDLSTYKDCGFCVHVQDQQYCYKNCQRHVDVDNFRTHPCWQWRGPQEGEPHETV